MSTEKIHCPSARQHLTLYAGRDLEPALCAQLEAHLAECEPCRAELAQTEQARARIVQFGAHTAAGLEQVDLWPAVQRRWASEREPRAAAPRRFRRTWVPLALASAAGLVLMLRWGGGQDALPAPITTPNALVVPGAPGSGIAVVPVAPASGEVAGGLRRAAPGDERLRDTSLPLQLPLRELLEPGIPGAPNVLAGDNDVR